MAFLHGLADSTIVRYINCIILTVELNPEALFFIAGILLQFYTFFVSCAGYSWSE